MMPLAHVFAWLCLPFRVIAVLVWTVLGLLAQLSCFAWVSRSTQRQVVRVWSIGMLACLGVRWSVHGPAQPTQSAYLLVANHISWLDILVLQAILPVVFVAKSEIRSWPVLGKMVALAGTCFIERDRRSALRGVHGALTKHLQDGQSVAIFPEGTTSDGASVLPFHAGLFESAIAAQVPVLPVKLHYTHPAAAYVGEITLIGSALRILLAPNLRAQVALSADLLDGTQLGRHALRVQAQQTVEQLQFNETR